MRRPWTDTELAVLRGFVADRAPRTLKEWEPCATALKRTVNSCRLQAEEKGYRSAPPAIGIIPPQIDTSPAPVEASATSPLHVKKLHVHVPREVVSSSGQMLTAVLYGDTHIPFHDQRSLDVVAQVIRIARPNVVVHQGDLLDCYHLSRFDKNPKRLHRLQDEIDAARAHLAAFRLLAPTARFIYLSGNHEDRLRRTLWSLPPHAEALLGLDAVTEALTWPKLLGLEELGIEHYDYGDQTRAQAKEPLLPRFMLKHGTIVRKLSGYTARAELDKYNRSGASGHTHRLGAFFHRDANGNHVWVETGCTCQLNPEYAQDPDWQAGAVVMTFEPTTGAFQVELVYIHEGTAVFRGHWIDARTP